MIILCLSFGCLVTFFIYFYLFFGGAGSSLLHGLSLVARIQGAALWHTRCWGFSWQWLLCGTWALGMWTSVGVAPGLSGCSSLSSRSPRLSSCGRWASLLRSMWDRLTRDRTVLPALAGGFSTFLSNQGSPSLVTSKWWFYCVFTWR